MKNIHKKLLQGVENNVTMAVHFQAQCFERMRMIRRFSVEETTLLEREWADMDNALLKIKEMVLNDIRVLTPTIRFNNKMIQFTSPDISRTT